jgi:hypothetical protein
VGSLTRTQCFLLNPGECKNVKLSVQTHRHILHFRCFFTLPFVPVWSNVALKNLSMSAVLPSHVVPESVTDWMSTSVGIPSLLTASESVRTTVLRFLANGFISVHMTLSKRIRRLTLRINASIFLLLITRLLINDFIIMCPFSCVDNA